MTATEKDKFTKIGLTDSSIFPLGELNLMIGSGKNSQLISGVHIRKKPKYLPRKIWLKLLQITITG